MKTQKQHRNDKLQKSSVLFLQLGLVLALFVTYALLEFESIKSELPNYTVENTEDPVIDFVPHKPFTIERTETKPIEKKVRSNSFENIEVVPDETPTPEEIFEPTDKDPESTISNAIVGLPDEIGEDEEDEPQPFIRIENPPIFPGCENLDRQASKKCFTNKISKFVNNKFNTDIADGLSGKQKIWVQFVIDKTGAITDIQARSLHKKLEKEAIRVVEKLPQMTPGMQRTTPVKVKYTLPIVFQTY